MTIYGCHQLRRGDNDGDPANGVAPTWGATNGAAAWVCTVPQPPVQLNPGAGNAAVVPQHVRQLQEDLRTLGFACVGTPDGRFGLGTFWAVREFQIYASLDRVARVRAAAPAAQQQGAHLVTALGANAAGTASQYVESLEGVANTGDGRYNGGITGEMNAATRTAINHWLQNNFRCPVVVEAWRVSATGARTTLLESNLWNHDQLQSSAPRMFARDFSQHYTLPTGRNHTDLHVIGDFVTYRTWSGPRSIPPSHTWVDAEFLPLPVTGQATPTGATLSTYRSIRAVAEVECIGHFDSVNCYDNAFVSVGPCHWTLGIATNAGAVLDGEMVGFLAYLEDAAAAAFTEVLGRFGVRPDQRWNGTAGAAAGTGDGSLLFDTGQRKYAGWLEFANEAGGFTPVPAQEIDGNYFKSWHWHYRWVMAGRCVADYRARMWHMARVRIRDLRATPWGTGVAVVATGGGATRPATIGDIFTSEKAMSLLLRWHVRYPAHVVSGGNAGQRLRRVLTNATSNNTTLTWTTDPSTWTTAHESALLTELLASPPSGVQPAFTSIDTWPSWLTVPNNNPRRFTLAAPIASALGTNRGSFAFDAANLPPAPP